MKVSKYNYIVEKEEKSYWYNGISHSYFTLEKGLGTKLLDVMMKNGLGMLQEKSPTFYNKIRESGFIVDDAVDEIDIIREEYKNIVEKKDYFLIVLPTLNCNFKCWYCVQNHIDTVMDATTISKVKRHIKKVVKEEKITSLQLEWFGGEPFMFFEEVIKPIGEYAMQVCREFDTPFTNTATTNGYYLTQAIHEELLNLNFHRFQITLDGKRSLHNTIKKTEDGTSAFDITLGNINNLLSRSNGTIEVQLRINYTEQTLDDEIIDQVNGIIEPNNRHSITIVLKKVWQEHVDHSRTDMIDQIMRKFKESGYACNVLDFIRNFIPCYTEKKWFNTINYNGGVLKCTASDILYSDTPPGKLEEDGSILWQEHFLSNCHISNFENDRCIKCKYLPICMGPCAEHYRINPHICKLKGFDMTFENQIYNFIKTEQQ
jgi:uncharacterized protein